jgi:hypothetical protein
VTAITSIEKSITIVIAIPFKENIGIGIAIDFSSTANNSGGDCCMDDELKVHAWHNRPGHLLP